MPVPTINHFINEGGFLDVPYVWATLKTIPWLVLVYILKIYFGGARNTSERDMHSKVVMITVCPVLTSHPFSHPLPCLTRGALTNTSSLTRAAHQASAPP